MAQETSCFGIFSGPPSLQGFSLATHCLKCLISEHLVALSLCSIPKFCLAKDVILHSEAQITSLTCAQPKLIRNLNCCTGSKHGAAGTWQ